MARIGRNDLCPCGSGKKFKKCCAGNPAVQKPVQTEPPSVNREVKKIQASAVAQQAAMFSLGVFVLFATKEGDAWLLEVTDMDAIQVAEAGKVIEVEIKENPETIEINWTHKFTVKNKKFVLTSYKDQSEQTKESYPAHSILAAVKKIRKRIPKELLSSLHLDEESGETAAQ
ncbi:MAG: SEC-C metal-binding domain-containing protein [Desulfobulbaceae bacterium]|nr:SEC-C metal-binding domain-containing protein [Desulfobulbaceae bacterium]HIJ78205.1 zinc chelation protein SecC [Deltaproteobacteria bacterium]